MTQSGQAFELQMQVLHTNASESLSLPTPTTRDYKDGSADHERDGKVQTDTVARAIFSSGEVKLFPTLRASDSYERRNQKTMDRIARDGGDMTMTTLARTTTDWGKFEPAIRRWESILGRPAPEPTKPDGKDNNHRLSSKFTEWMMGLPDGWITGHDLKRNDELKLAGNGVVPQQAELALRLLLELPERKENDNE
jgi:DNA (cytosine-5)-methyltransferase 1